MILVVDDDEAIRETLDQALTFYGYHVMTAGNGAEALEKLSSHHSPCLILLDLMMPVMDGWSFVAAMKKSDAQWATTPVVVLSAYTTANRPIQATEFIQKPINLSVLLDVVSKYCGDPQSPQAMIKTQ